MGEKCYVGIMSTNNLPHDDMQLHNASIDNKHYNNFSFNYVSGISVCLPVMFQRLIFVIPISSMVESKVSLMCTMGEKSLLCNAF